MRTYSEKRQSSPLYRNPFLLIILIFLSVVFTKGAWGWLEKARVAHAEKVALESELGDLKARKAYIEERLSGIEKVGGEELALRSKFNVKKEGESVAVIVPEETKAEDGYVPFKSGGLADIMASVEKVFATIAEAFR